MTAESSHSDWFTFRRRFQATGGLLKEAISGFRPQKRNKIRVDQHQPNSGPKLTQVNPPFPRVACVVEVVPINEHRTVYMIAHRAPVKSVVLAPSTSRAPRMEISIA